MPVHTSMCGSAEVAELEQGGSLCAPKESAAACKQCIGSIQSLGFFGFVSPLSCLVQLIRSFHTAFPHLALQHSLLFPPWVFLHDVWASADLELYPEMCIFKACSQSRTVPMFFFSILFHSRSTKAFLISFCLIKAARSSCFSPQMFL